MIRLIKPYISFDEVESDFRTINVIKQYTDTKYCYLTTNATTALWMCLKALGIKKGDEVIVSDFSFPASINVIEDLDAIPIFADVDLKTYNMLPSELEKKITKNTKAVMFVDALGNPSGLLEIKNI